MKKVQRIDGEETIIHPRAPGDLEMQHTTELVGRDKQGRALFRCICECGKEVNLRKELIFKPQKYCSNQCPILRLKRIPNLVGKRFGKLVVLELVGNSGRNALWLCKCDCGNLAKVRTGSLQHGEVKRCKKHSDLSSEERLERKRANARKSNKKNPARIKANKIRYENKLAKATPKWLAKEDWETMNSFYQEARRLTLETGISYQIDYIIPINGKTVCGLHVPNNLQILTKSENVSKSNRYAEL